MCVELNKISKGWWNPKSNTLAMGYGYGMTADSVGYNRAKKDGITLDMDQLDKVVAMMKKGELQKHLNNWIVTKHSHVIHLIGCDSSIVDMKLYGNPIYGRQVGFDQNGRWMNLSYFIFKALMEECYGSGCINGYYNPI